VPIRCCVRNSDRKSLSVNDLDTNDEVGAAVIVATAAALAMSLEEVRLALRDGADLELDSPSAEAVIARAEEILGGAPLAEVADLKTGIRPSVRLLVSLLRRNRALKQAAS
jgi:hypothetical protein